MILTFTMLISFAFVAHSQLKVPGQIGSRTGYTLDVNIFSLSTNTNVKINNSYLRTFSPTTSGIVPASGPTNTAFLRSDGTWTGIDNNISSYLTNSSSSIIYNYISSYVSSTVTNTTVALKTDLSSYMLNTKGSYTAAPNVAVLTSPTSSTIAPTFLPRRIEKNDYLLDITPGTYYTTAINVVSGQLINMDVSTDLTQTTAYAGNQINCQTVTSVDASSTATITGDNGLYTILYLLNTIETGQVPVSEGNYNIIISNDGSLIYKMVISCTNGINPIAPMDIYYQIMSM